jgi:diguanylate cyclase (GGDEF)-like protein
MQSDEVLPLSSVLVLPTLSVVAQLVGAALAATLFALLRHFVLRRGYFTSWLWAWAAGIVAAGGFALRTAPGIAHPQGPGWYIASFIAYAAQTFGVLLFVRGAALYVGHTRISFERLIRPRTAVAISAALAAVAAQLGTAAAVWQIAISALLTGYGAALLLRMPISRRTVGTRTLGFGFALLCVIGLFSAVAMGVTFVGGAYWWVSPAQMVVAVQPFMALLTHAVLAFAMIVLLMEDSRREVAAAHAELRLSHDRMRMAALTDSLTDCLNRRAFTEGLGLDVVRSTFGAVVLADLDNLKVINDRYGHTAGDRLLIHCADTLRPRLRPYDKLYRWGGDEFLLILPSARAADVVPRFESVFRLAETVPAGRTQDRLALEVSVGAADYASADDLAAAISKADRAMYAAKSRRKGPAARHTPMSHPAINPTFDDVSIGA